MDKKILTSPCGLDCFSCRTYEGNITEEWKKQVSEFLKIPVEETPCKGCRAEMGNCRYTPGSRCVTWECVHEKGLAFCYECNDFPCEMLMPSKMGADFPHNLKVYNLCRIKNVGIDKWLEEIEEIRKRYFEGSFEVGKGPVLKK